MKRYTITDEHYQKFNLTARGQEFLMVIYYSNYSDAWYMDVNISDGEYIVKGERMVSGVDLGFKYDFKGVYILDKNLQPRDPKADGWKDLYIYILNEDELEAQARAKVPEPVYLIDDNSNPLVDGLGFYLTV